MWQAAVCSSDGHVRAYQGIRKIAKTHVIASASASRTRSRYCNCPASEDNSQSAPLVTAIADDAHSAGRLERTELPRYNPVFGMHRQTDEILYGEDGTDRWP
jgi:hypothetical protein